MAMMTFLTMAAVASAQSAPATQAPASQLAVPKVNCVEMHTLPVQYAGRIMPLDTLARAMIREVTGKRSWQGHDPVMLLLAWTWQGEPWKAVPLVLVGDPALQKEIGLPVEGKHFSYAELVTNARLAEYRQSAEHGGASNQALSATQRAMLRNAQQVGERLRILEMIFQGQIIRFVPSADKDGTWATADEVTTQTGTGATQQDKILAGWNNVREAFLAGDDGRFGRASIDLTNVLEALHSPAWPQKQTLELEVLYNLVRPFQKGWWCTLPAMALGLLSLGTTSWRQRGLRLLAWGALLNGFSLMTLGLVLRWKFSGHTPVSTMHESLVFMGWGAVAIGVAMMVITRRKSALPIVAAVATAILVVADTVPLE